MSAATMSSADAVKSPTVGVGAAAKQQVKQSNSGKAVDAARKHTGSPVDGQKGRTPPSQPKAWQGPNPITQRATTHTLNGTEKPLPKLPTQSHNQSKSTMESNSDKHAHDRALFLIANLVGLDATLTLKNGEQFAGVFSGGSFESNSKPQYIMKMVRRTLPPTGQQINGNIVESSEYIGEGEDHVMAFDKDDTVDLAVNNVVTVSSLPVQNGSIASSFRTDTEISGRDPTVPRERTLQRWEPGAGDAIGMSLEDSGASGWDQFAANQQMYGVETTYDEDIYTTSIDRTDPLYKQREAVAARIAREIEGSSAATAHVAEERRVDADLADAGDEEEKYSGVHREASQLPRRGTGAYVPPSQRPITNMPTVAGAPFDPAIISSSLAKPAAPAALDKATDTATATELPPVSGAQTPTTTDRDPSPNAADGQATQSAKKQGENTAEDHVRNTVDAFKLFANDQKLRSRQAMEARRSSARAEKNVKLNDLKKFAENFNLRSRIPDDLIAILAKDPLKQLAIQNRAEESAKIAEQKVLKIKEKELEGQKSANTASPTAATSSQAGTPPVEQRSSFTQQQPNVRARATQNLRGQPTQQPTGKGMTPAAVPANKGYQRPGPFPNDVRIPTGPSGEAALSPTTGTKLNVNAPAFSFRAGATSFTPSASSPSPQRTTGSSMDRSNLSTVSVSAKPATLFDKDRKPTAASERKNLEEAFAPTLAMLDREYPDEHKKANSANGGVPKPYQTGPTWPYTDANVNASYKDAYTRPQIPSSGPSPMHTPNPTAPMPHQHQLPPHMQGTPLSTPSQRPQYMQHPSQTGASPQMFDPRMQQFGPNGSVQSSPRFPQAQMAYNGQMPGMGMPQFAGQQMQGYGVSPSMQYRQINMPPTGPMMMMPPNQQHGQMPNMPQGYPPRGPGGPAYNPQMMGGVPMMQQHSAQGFMNSAMPPQNPSYSPMASQGHMGGAQQHMQNAGYANNARGPHMMQHTNSHQGYQQTMSGGPFGGVAASPGSHSGPQHYPYNMQQRQMSSGGGAYPHMMTPRQQYSVPSHPSPGMGGAGAPGQVLAPVQGQGDEGK